MSACAIAVGSIAPLSAVGIVMAAILIKTDMYMVKTSKGRFIYLTSFRFLTKVIVHECYREVTKQAED
jgi:hypothetical protein